MPTKCQVSIHEFEDAQWSAREWNRVVSRLHDVYDGVMDLSVIRGRRVTGGSAGIGVSRLQDLVDSRAGDPSSEKGAWRAVVIAAGRLATGTSLGDPQLIYGWMPDVRSPYREGCAVFTHAVRDAKPTDSYRENWLAWVVAHELGHVFNLSHCLPSDEMDDQNIMDPLRYREPNETDCRKARLSPSDEAFLRLGGEMVRPGSGEAFRGGLVGGGAGGDARRGVTLEITVEPGMENRGRGRPTFVQGEPVCVQWRVINGSRRRLALPTASCGCGGISFELIGEDGAPRLLTSPDLVCRGGGRLHFLGVGESVAGSVRLAHRGGRVVLDRSGRFELAGRLVLPEGGVLRSNPLELEVVRSWGRTGGPVVSLALERGESPGVRRMARMGGGDRRHPVEAHVLAGELERLLNGRWEGMRDRISEVADELSSFRRLPREARRCLRVAREVRRAGYPPLLGGAGLMRRLHAHWSGEAECPIRYDGRQKALVLKL